jgi:pimeloyl-ACP methyl ester carboxylesterase
MLPTPGRDRRVCGQFCIDHQTKEPHMSNTTEQSSGAPAIRPFQIEFPEEELAELRRRIAATRLPTKELVADRSQGVHLATIRELARYWTTDYDWRACEARLNALPQFKTEIDGVDVHFIHVKSRHENALPLIMTHGWPGSVIELLETVGPLTDPAAHGGSAGDAFDLVLPSIPGYGFSGEPAEIGWHSGRVAQAWPELMRRLGYTRYVAQGGDQGAAVTDAMGRQAPEGLAGIHMNLLVTALGGGAMPAETEAERAALEQTKTFRASGFGYFLEQATRPQTIGYALLDSPLGRGCGRGRQRCRLRRCHQIRGTQGTRDPADADGAAAEHRGRQWPSSRRCGPGRISGSTRSSSSTTTASPSSRARTGKPSTAARLRTFRTDS